MSLIALITWITTAGGGLYLDADGLTWVAVGALGGAASSRTLLSSRILLSRRALLSSFTTPMGGRVAVVSRLPDVGPPERNFPLPVVVAHGFFALITITLVVLTALGVGGS